MFNIFSILIFGVIFEGGLTNKQIRNSLTALRLKYELNPT